MHAHTHTHTERQAVYVRFGSIFPFNRLEKADFEGQLYILVRLFLKKDSRNREEK